MSSETLLDSTWREICTQYPRLALDDRLCGMVPAHAVSELILMETDFRLKKEWFPEATPIALFGTKPKRRLLVERLTERALSHFMTHLEVKYASEKQIMAIDEDGATDMLRELDSYNNLSTHNPLKASW